VSVPVKGLFVEHGHVSRITQTVRYARIGRNTSTIHEHEHDPLVLSSVNRPRSFSSRPTNTNTPHGHEYQRSSVCGLPSVLSEHLPSSVIGPCPYEHEHETRTRSPNAVRGQSVHGLSLCGLPSAVSGLCARTRARFTHTAFLVCRLRSAVNGPCARARVPGIGRLDEMRGWASFFWLEGSIWRVEGGILGGFTS